MYPLVISSILWLVFIVLMTCGVLRPLMHEETDEETEGPVARFFGGIIIWLFLGLIFWLLRFVGDFMLLPVRVLWGLFFG